MIGIYFRNIFPIGGLISSWSSGLTIFQSTILKWLLSNFKVVNTCEVRKGGKVCQFLKWCLEKIDIKL